MVALGSLALKTSAAGCDNLKLHETKALSDRAPSPPPGLSFEAPPGVWVAERLEDVNLRLRQEIGALARQRQRLLAGAELQRLRQENKPLLAFLESWCFLEQLSYEHAQFQAMSLGAASCVERATWRPRGRLGMGGKLVKTGSEGLTAEGHSEGESALLGDASEVAEQDIVDLTLDE